MKLYDALNEALLSTLLCFMCNQFGFNIKVQYTLHEFQYEKESSANWELCPVLEPDNIAVRFRNRLSGCRTGCPVRELDKYVSV